MQALLQSLWTAIEPGLVVALKAAIASVVPAAALFVRSYLQRKAADLAVAHAETHDVVDAEKKAIATDRLATAGPLIRPLGAANVSAAIEKAVARAKGA